MTRSTGHSTPPATDLPAPPRLALRLAGWLIDDRLREALIGDLVQTFHSERIATLGPARARRWFWRQTALAIRHFPPHPRLPRSTGDNAVTGFLDDIGRATRALRRAPAFALACVLTLAVGIGAATAIFSVADPVILRPLPYPAPDRLFMAWERDAAGARSNLGFATIADVQARNRSFEQLAAVGGWAPTLVQGGVAEQLTGLRVSWNYFATLGVHPAIGRSFLKDEDVQARNGVVVISHSLWQTRFGADSAAVGRMSDIGGRSVLVAGVMPADYDDVLLPGAQVWRVLGYERDLPFACRSCRHLRLVGRLKPGVTAASAGAELNILSASMVQQFPKEYPAAGFQLVSLQSDMSRAVRPAVLALLTAVALLLIIAIVNVTGLQLARALVRDEEFAIRVAVGAGTWRLTRQLLAEALVVAVAAAGAGWLIALIGLRQLVGRLPATMPRVAAVHLDARAVEFALLATLIATSVVGLIPAWHARRRALADALRGGRIAGGASHRVRAALVIAEVALAVILLSGSGLLARSLARLLAVNVGVDVATVADAQIQVSGPRYADNAAVWQWQDQVVAAARQLPGVQAAGLANQLPLDGNVDSYGIQARDKPLDNPELAPSADRYTVTPDFLRTMRIPILDGRNFEAADNSAGSADVAIVSEALARRIWPGERAIGKQIHLGEPERPWYTVIGVAGNVHHHGLDVNETLQVYIPARRFFFSDNVVNVVVRMAGDPASVLPALRRAVTAADPVTVVLRVATMRQVVANSTAQRRLAVSLFSVFAVIALFLAGAGIFGALAGIVSERRREIGLRSALGATPRQIVHLVLRQSLAMTAAGATIGLAASFVMATAIEKLLFNVQAGDAVTSIGSLLIMALAALAASALPVLRAVRVDPITALRTER